MQIGADNSVGKTCWARLLRLLNNMTGVEMSVKMWMGRGRTGSWGGINGSGEESIVTCICGGRGGSGERVYEYRLEV